MFIGKLSGFSGCSVELHQNTHGKYFVHKQSGSIYYNNRLIEQCQKQKNFKNEVISKPIVFDTGYINKKFYYNMEYIKGKCLYDIFTRNTFRDILPHLATIISYILSQKQTGTVSKLVIENKINSIKLDNIYEKHLATNIIKNLPDEIPTSYCHGDLTLENIILNDKKIYFIDFLNSFLNCKYIDIGKILQDILYFWSWRNSDHKPIVNCMKAYNYIKSKLNEEELRLSESFAKLNLLRILPYKKNNTFLDNTIKYICEKI